MSAHDYEVGRLYYSAEKVYEREVTGLVVDTWHYDGVVEGRYRFSHLSFAVADGWQPGTPRRSFASLDDAREQMLSWEHWCRRVRDTLSDYTAPSQHPRECLDPSIDRPWPKFRPGVPLYDAWFAKWKEGRVPVVRSWLYEGFTSKKDAAAGSCPLCRGHSFRPYTVISDLWSLVEHQCEWPLTYVGDAMAADFDYFTLRELVEWLDEGSAEMARQASPQPAPVPFYRSSDLSEVEIAPGSSGEVLESIEKRERVRRLVWVGAEITGKHLLALATFPALEELALDAARFHNSELAELPRLSNIKSLELRGSSVDDLGLIYIGRVPSLESLDLDTTMISNDGLRHLAGLSRLSALGLARTAVTGRGLEHLAGLQNLRDLHLLEANVDDHGIAALEDFKQLARLVLAGTRVTDRGLRHLQRLTDLVRLSLWKTSVSDEGIRHFSGLPNLAYLDLGETSVTDAGLAGLAGLPSLKELILHFDNISDAGMEHLAKATTLRALWLGGTRVTDRGIRHLAALPMLETLVLWSTLIGDAALDTLAKIGTLKRLGLRNTRVSAEALERFRAANPECQTDRPFVGGAR